MGRAKKIVSSTPGGAPVAPAPVALEAQLRQQLAQVRAEIQAIPSADMEKVATGLRLAGLQQRMWDLEGQLSPDINVRLACARQSAQWAEQVVRCAKGLQIDLLRELFAKAEAMEKHSSLLKDLK